MSDLVIGKFGSGLSAASLLRCREMMSHRKHLRAREDLARQGETMPDALFVVDGFLCRYKLLSGGRRAVVAYLLPGDFCGLPPDSRQRLDHGIGCLTPAVVAEVPRPLLRECLSADAALAGRVAAASVTEAAIQRQWLANMSCPSDRRMAHLLCELRARLARVGLGDERGFQLPLTQHDLSEALGISTVHVNRVLQHLKDMGLVRITDRQVIIGDLAQLEFFAEFDPAYLGMDAEQAPALLAAGE